MRVVLDTNIFFSALISPHGVTNEIYRAWRSGRFELITSRLQLNEIRAASRYPKLRNIVPHAKMGALINILQGAVVLDRLN
jgi:putative PIN family toxin of toxin-antitoxin system